MRISVLNLLRSPFHNRTKPEKKKIILNGKPRPPLMGLTSSYCIQSRDETDEQSTNKRFKVIFDIASYDHVEWLTGCDKRQALFCWPCVLFRGGKKDPWNWYGIKNLNNLRKKIDAHEKCVSHIESVLALQFCTSTLKVQAPKVQASKLQLKELIAKNREVTKRVIDVICYLVSVQKHPRTGYRDANALEVEDCLKILSFLRDFSKLEVRFIDDAVQLIQATPTPKIITEVIEAINCTIKNSIRNEVDLSTYVSLILSAHKTEGSRTQISAVLRYVKNGKVCERFVGFSNVDGLKSSNLILRLIQKYAAEFGISQRIIAYSLNSSILAALPTLLDLESFVQTTLPNVHFVPGNYHSLHSILLDSLSSYSGECDLFFKSMSTIKTFFQEDSSLWQQFQKFIRGTAVPSVEGFHSSNFAVFLNALKTCRIILMEFFDEMVSDNEKLTDADLVKISGIRAFLADFKTIFLLQTFVKLFDIISPLVDAFESPLPGSVFDTKLIERILKSLDEEITSANFENWWNQTLRLFDELKKMETTNSTSNIILGNERLFRKLFWGVVLNMQTTIKNVFRNARKLSFCHILDLGKSAKKLDSEHVLTLEKTYSLTLNESLLDKEIKLVVENKSSMVWETVHELYNFFYKSGLCNSFSNLNKLCELVLTMPSTIADITGGFSKIDQVNLWSYTPGKQEAFCNVSLLCVEKDYLAELKEKPSFHDDVMSELMKIDKSLKLQ